MNIISLPVRSLISILFAPIYWFLDWLLAWEDGSEELEREVDGEEATEPQYSIMEKYSIWE